MRMRVLVPAALVVCLLAVAALCFGQDSVCRGYSGRQWAYSILYLRCVVVDCEITAEGIEQMNKVGIIAGENMEHVLNRFGAEGWELVSFSSEMAVFKRPL